MKKFYLSAALVLSALTSSIAQTVVFSTSLESWGGTPNLPTDMFGSKSNIVADSVIQVTGSSSYGNNAARLKNTTTTHKRFTTLPMNVVNGTSYEIKFWVKGQGEIRTGLFDGRSTGFGYAPYNAYITVSSSAWTMYSQNITCANDTTDGEFILSVRSTVGPDHMMVDSIAIIELSSTPTNASIYQIQYTTSVPANSPYNGQFVNTGGIVTGYYSNGYFLQSGFGAWNGIMVYDTVNNPISGDSITVTAAVEEFFNNTRLTTISNYTLVSSGNTVPNPEIITTTQGNTEDFEGCLVKVTAPCSDDNAGFGMWTLYSSPDSLKIDDLMYSFTPTIGLTYEVIGCVEYSYGEFKVNPRKPSDVTVISGISELNEENALKMYPNPSSTHVNFDVEENASVYVFDVTGKEVITIKGGTLYTANLENGTYLVKIMTPTGVETGKLVVKH